MKKKVTNKAVVMVKKARSPKRATGAVTAVPSLVLPPHEEIVSKVRQATASGKWLIVSIRVEGDTVFMDRMSVNFPKNDIGMAQRLIVEDLDKLKAE